MSSSKKGRAIQRSLSGLRRDVKDDVMITHKCSQLMMEGRVRGALQLLSRETRSGPLSLDRVVSDGSYRTVRDILEDDHHDSEHAAHADAILNEDLNNTDFHPILFDSITDEVIRNSAVHTAGSAGPSGVDAFSWKTICTAFDQKSNDICSALSAVTRMICTTYVDPLSLMACTSRYLVPLEKCPGVRPVGIGKVVHRIIGKTVMRSVKHNLLEAVDCIQLCAGQDSGCSCHGKHFC